MKYIIIWKSNPQPEILNEKQWQWHGEAARNSKDIVAIHVYGEDGKWDCDVNMELK